MLGRRGSSGGDEDRIGEKKFETEGKNSLRMMPTERKVPNPVGRT